MANQQKNTLLRVLVPLVLLLAGIGLAVLMFTNTSNQKRGSVPSGVPAGQQQAQGGGTPQGATPSETAPPAAMPASAQTQPPAAAAEPAPAGGDPTTGAAQAGPASGAEVKDLGELRPLVFDLDAATRDFVPIGAISPRSGYEAEVHFTTLGAGIREMVLANHFETVKRIDHIRVQREHIHTPGNGQGSQVVAPMAAASVEINGRNVPLWGWFDDPVKGRVGDPVWRQTAPGAFEAFVVDGAGNRVVRIGRAYSIQPASFDVLLEQKIENLTGEPLRVRWFQFGPVDMDPDPHSYGGEKRRVRFGYLLNPQLQGSDPTVLANDFLWARSDSQVFGPLANGYYETIRGIWPNDVSAAKGHRLVWAGLTNRYFGAANHPYSPGPTPNQKELRAVETVDRVLLHARSRTTGEYDPVMILRTASPALELAAGGTADLSTGLYAGPLSRPVIAREPAADASGLRGLVVYNFGGMCAWCTFPFLTTLLLGLLRFLHDYVVFDWALAIIVLVLVVRTILHPVTRWSQIRMQRFGKQMQGIAPKQKKLQEKFGSDPQKMREEMGKLWREEGISPTGMLGCIPMFLQTPIWIALYAMLFFAFELRHNGAFFGVFQAIQPQNWPTWWFLGDLSEPDRFLYFGRTLVNIPLLGPIDSLNILPLVLAVVFYIQQKYLTPPTTAALTPEQEQQQKIMKWMMVVMFPLIMYGAPSGLAIYFIANSTLGILESKWIRAHIEKHDLLNPPKAGPKGAKTGGFLSRLQQVAEERQRQAMKARGMQPPRKKV